MRHFFLSLYDLHWWIYPWLKSIVGLFSLFWQRKSFPLTRLMKLWRYCLWFRYCEFCFVTCTLCLYMFCLCCWQAVDALCSFLSWHLEYSLGVMMSSIFILVPSYPKFHLVQFLSMQNRKDNFLELVGWCYFHQYVFGEPIYWWWDLFVILMIKWRSTS